MKIWIPLLLAFCSFKSHSQPLGDKHNTLLWAVINAKGDTSYLFGTFHEFGSSYFRKYPEIGKKFISTSALYLEQVPEPVQFRLGTALSAITKRSWISELSNTDYKIINDYLVRLDYDVPLKKMKGVSPFVLKYMIGQDLIIKACAIEDTADNGLMEETLYYRAPKYSIQVLGLEKSDDSTVRKTYQFVSGSESEATSIASIIDIAKNEEKYLDSIRNSGQCGEVDNYRNATIDYHFSNLSTNEAPDYSFALDARNAAWLPTIIQSIETHKTFIAVGFKHLQYQHGLINLLLDKGYKVVPIGMK